ncbi:AAA family ATPase [Myxococcota bacterium]|nr:AAA family ATPase [Myxococcota bacterium]
MSLQDELAEAIQKLDEIRQADTTEEAERVEAKRHLDELKRLRERLESRALQANLIGSVGVGKTSLLAALAGLYVGERPKSVDEQAARSILTIAAGKTTAFTVRVRAPQGDEASDKLGLHVQAVSTVELRRIVETVAEMELFSRRPMEERGQDQRPERAGEELRRVVLNMTGYGERKEIYSEGNLKRQRIVRPLDEAARQLTELSALTSHLLERLNQQGRSTKEWPFEDSPAGREALRELFGRLNLGTEAGAPLPEEITLIVPWLPAAQGGQALTLLDTRGIDGAVASRGDLFSALREPDAVTVLCSSFVDAPSPRVREVLHELSRDLTLRSARQRLILVIIDKREAARVIDAEGDRESGQLSRREDCWRALEAEGLIDGLSLDRVVVFDPLQDDPHTLLGTIQSCHSAHLKRLEVRAQKALEASRPLREGEAADKALRERLDLLVMSVLRQHPLDGNPLEDPLRGLKQALAGCPFAFRLRAAVRWEGTFNNLHLLNAVAVAARAAATSWLMPLQHALTERVLEERDRAKTPGERAPYNTLLEELDEAFEATVDDYGREVLDEVTLSLKGASVWQDAQGEWGKGSGYRERVIDKFERWGKLQPFTAHRTTTLAKHIPQLAKIQEPEEAPGFILVAENLRRVKRLCWTLQGVNLLIGANGSGKTTTIAAMRFMERAYEVGVARAVVLALGGRNNLKSWGVSEDEPVRIALKQGQTQWEITLTPDSAGERVDVHERLVHRGEELLSVNALGRVTYRGLDLGGAGEDSGLRFLTRLRKVDPPINRMAALAQSLHGFRVPNLIGLKEQGSNPQNDQRLESQGGNTFSVLRRFTQEHASRARLEFVLDGLQLAFPGLFSALEFRSAGNTLALNIVPPDGRPPHGIGHEADGVLQCLVNLVAVASANPGDVVALDQPDDHLHPYAARVLLRRIEAWAHRHKLTVILATHSIVLLDAMKGSPERVFVMTPNDDGSVPNALTDLYNSDWLQSFELGELYKNDEIGSNVDDA